MSDLEFWKILLNQLVSEGLLTTKESSEIIKQLMKEMEK